MRMFAIALAALNLLLVQSVGNPNAPAYIRQDFGIVANNTYVFNMEVGTPPQMVSVVLDFGSSDLTLADGPNECLNVTCSWQKSYRTVMFNQSKSLRYNNSYVSAPLSSDGSLIAGMWAVDNVTFGNDGNVSANGTSINIRDLATYKLGEHNSNSVTVIPNIFGLGPRGLQATVEWLDDNGYPGPVYNNMLYNMDNMYPGYSLWIDPHSNSRGSLYMGGIDDTYYVPGTMTSVPIAIPSNQYGGLQVPIYLGLEYTNMLITVQTGPGKGIYNQNIYNTNGALAVLNSRTGFSLPRPLLEGLGNTLGAEWSLADNMYIVRCNTHGNVSLMINGFFQLDVSLGDHLIDLSMEDQQGTPLCGLNIAEANQVYLSNLALKNYFMVIDYKKNEIVFGQPRGGHANDAPRHERPLDGTYSSMTTDVARYFSTIVDPDGSFQYGVTTATLPSIQYYGYQTSSLLLRDQPAPTVLMDNVTLSNSTLIGSMMRNHAPKKTGLPKGFLCTIITGLLGSIYSIL